jgi:hypothetical protein
MFGKIVIVNNELMKIKGHLNPEHLKKKIKKKKKKKKKLFAELPTYTAKSEKQ